MTDTTPIQPPSVLVGACDMWTDEWLPTCRRSASPREAAVAVLHGMEWIAWCTNYGRARLLAHQPDRPTGVPDGAALEALESVIHSFWLHATNWMRLCSKLTTDERTIVGTAISRASARLNGMPVPPYQPAPDPADSPTDATHADHYRTCNCLADSAECCRPSCTCHAHPSVATGKRTGPLGLSEEATRDIAARWRNMGGGSLSGILAAEAMGDACRAAVAEWDAEPQPAETLADIVADLRNGDELDRDYADRIEAASRPDPDTITVNRYDVRRAVDELDDATELPSPDLTRVILRLRAALAAAGLPQEDGS